MFCKISTGRNKCFNNNQSIVRKEGTALIPLNELRLVTLARILILRDSNIYAHFYD